MAIVIAQTMYTAIDNALQSVLLTGMTKVMLGIGALFGTFWMLNFTLKSIFWLYQGMTVAFREVVIEIAKVAFIAGLAWNVAWFVQTIVPFVTGFPAWMGGILSGQSGSQVTQIDSMITTYVDSLIDLIAMQKFSLFSNMVTILIGVVGVSVYILGGMSFLLVAVGTTILLKLATTIMLIVGPLFIAFALFDQTRQWFWGWVSLVAGFMLTQVLFSVVVALEIGFINTFIIVNGSVDMTLTGVFTMLICFATFTVLATELPNYAASVMGGTPSQTGGLGGILSKGSGVGAAVNAARGAKKMIGKIKARNNIA